jgi:hypothetical protein
VGEQGGIDFDGHGPLGEDEGVGAAWSEGGGAAPPLLPELGDLFVARVLG